MSGSRSGDIEEGMNLTYVCMWGHALRYWAPFQGRVHHPTTFACADHVEPFFYNLGVRARCGLSDKLCCFCAEGEAEGPDEGLQKMFTTVLPVCSACLSKGAKIIVMHAIRNCRRVEGISVMSGVEGA